MPLEINQYPITAVKLEDPDLFDQDADDGVGGWESRKVPWSLIKLELQTGLTFYNISNSNLVADSNYTYGLNGSLLSDTWTIKTGGGTPIQQFRGNNTVYIPTGTVGHNGFPSSIIQYSLNGNGGAYGFLVTGTNSTAGYASQGLGGSTPNQFLAYKVLKTAFRAETGDAGTVDRFGFDSDFQNTNTNDNVCFRANAVNPGAGAAIAFHLLAGDIKLPSGAIGQTQTLTFGGGGSGDVASITYENGIQVSQTLVP